MIESTTRHSANGSEGDSNEVVSHSTRTPLSSQLSLGPERIPPTSARKSGDELAEVFCSSLADIASEACACRHEATVRSRSSHGKGVLQRGNSEEIGDWSSRCSTNGSGAAVVTEKTSSGDDVESRANTSNVASLLGDRRSLPVSVGHDNGEVFCEPSGAAQQFHHYPHRQRRHSEREGAGTTGELPLGGDPLQDCNSHLHAANRRRVTASSPLSKHCPSPKASFEAMLATTTSSMRSGKIGAARKNTGLSKGRKNTKGVLAHHMAGTYPMQRATHRFAQLQQKRTDSDGMTSNEPRDAFKKAWMKMDSASFSNGSPSSPSSRTSDDDIEGWNGSYSGSGTEGGYAASASSNETLSGAERSCSSDLSAEALKLRHINTSCNPDASEHGRKQESTFSTSSDIADFSSGGSEFESVDESIPDAVSDSASNALSSNGSRFFDEREDEFKATKRNHPRRQASIPRNHLSLSQLAMQNSNKVPNQTNLTVKPSACHEINGKAPILALGGDVMAYVLAFLEPPKILEVITAPLSKDWLNAFSHQSELWRVLCLQEPLKARIENEPDSDDESFTGSFSSITGSQHRLTFGKFRLLYTAFVRCMKYLARIKDDASNGRPLSVVDYGVADGMGSHDIGSNQNLRQFLARSRGVSFPTGKDEQADTPHSGSRHHAFATITQPIGVSDNGSATKSKRKHKEEECMAVKKMRRFASGPSALTQRLLGPSSTGTPGNTELPWSCAIFSIVNWMLAFSDVEGIQTMCLRDLPSLLEDEQQRITAQRAGLTDVVLRAMVTFPDSGPLHTAAFHTIVLLARPLGGREGMLFHTSMVNSSGIFSASSVASRNGKSGIAVMLDSMKRFQQDEVLQAMSCWSLVNIALAPAQKEVLVSLGGIEVTSRAMCAHPHSAEVQFRALFALINLVIPSRDQGEPLRGEVITEKEMLDESVDQIVNLVLLAMKNFCASEAIVNRACLVLHNVSLTREYHETLLCCPNCYQMLEWCLANYPTDQVLQQSASGTLHRLQLTLNSDEILRTRFATSLQAQQQVSLENVHREAIAAHEQQAQSRTI
jgi:hypothetical protein